MRLIRSLASENIVSRSKNYVIVYWARRILSVEERKCSHAEHSVRSKYRVGEFAWRRLGFFPHSTLISLLLILQDTR